MSIRNRTLLKVILLGDSGVGKTSLMNRYVFEELNRQYRSTVGADFFTKDIDIDGKPITLQIWDTAGQERYRSVGAQFYRGADCCILVYDVNILESFEKLQNWHDEFLKQVDPTEPYTFPFIVVGNKVDVDGGNSRVVSEETAKEWCASMGKMPMPYFETSAKENYNVDDAFICIAKAALLNPHKREMLSFHLQESSSEIEDSVGCGRCAC